MKFDRFDIIEAYYLFGSLYHGGQFTKEYKYMGRCLNAGFKPPCNFRLESLSDNARMIFDNLVGNYNAKLDSLAEAAKKRASDAYTFA